MELKLVRHLWGMTETWETAFPKFKAFGYSAIECPPPGEDVRPKFLSLLKQHGFDYIPQAFTGGPTPAAHAESFEKQLENAKSMGAIKMVCHSGSDAWSPDDANRYFELSLAIEKKVGLPVAHETHRGRQLFNPWQTRDLLKAHPALNLCADFSHWVCVAERLLNDCGEIIALAASRTIHIHSRVGFEEGPQVPDPRAPEYAGHVAAHEKWWDEIWKSQKSRGMKVSTLTPEFGPPSYLHTLPYTQQPLASLWDICDWMANRQRSRFKAAN